MLMGGIREYIFFMQYCLFLICINFSISDTFRTAIVFNEKELDQKAGAQNYTGSKD